MKLALILLLSFYLFYATWIAYLAIMHLKKSRDAGTLSKFTYYFAWPLLFVGYCLDIFINLTICSVLFLEPPREFLLTSRLSRHIKKGSGWRKDLSKAICDNLLDPFDEGHCD